MDFPSGGVPLTSNHVAKDMALLRRWRADLSGRPILGAVTLALFVWLIQATVILRTASPLPFWDQWDAETGLLFKKILDRSVTLGDWLKPANEHRIFFTRVLNVTIFTLSGYRVNCLWSILAQAGLHSAIAGLYLWLLNRERVSWFGSLLIVFLFAWPLSNENYYWSYQSQIYFQMLITILAIVALAEEKSHVFVVLFVGAGALNMATTLVIPLLGFASSLLRYLRRRDRRDLGWGATYLAFAVLVYKLIPFNPANDVYRAKGASEFLTGLAEYVDWPHQFGWYCLIPFTWLLWRAVVRRDARPRILIPLFVFGWAYALMIFASYGRHGEIPDRYNEYIVISAIASALGTHAWFNERPRSKAWAVLGACATIWYVVCAQNETKGNYPHWERRFAHGTAVVREALAAAVQRPGSALAILQEKKQNLYPRDDILAGYLEDLDVQFMLRDQLSPALREVVVERFSATRHH